MYEVMVILGLILLNGLFAMSEIALISARKSSLATEGKRGNKAARLALRLADDPDRFLATVQIGITLIGILTGIYSGETLADNFSAVLLDWGVPVGMAHPLAQTLVVLAVTYLTLIFGELVPKRIGLNRAERMAKAVARPMRFLSLLAAPFVWLLSRSTALVSRMLGIRHAESRVTEEEIRSMIREGTEDGAVQQVEQGIMERVFFLGDRSIGFIMTQRSELVWLEAGMTREEVREVLRRQLYGMYPVAGEEQDEVVGVVSVKELVLHLGDEDFSLDRMIRPAPYFHENMSVYRLLEQMKEQKISRALVCDEFGMCVGIVTLRDILEALVGTVRQEEEEEIVPRADGNGWVVSGQCPFYHFLNRFDRTELHENEAVHTVGGLILEVLEHIPQVGERLEWNGFRFEVLEMDGVRIHQVAVTCTEPGQHDPGSSVQVGPVEVRP